MIDIAGMSERSQNTPEDEELSNAIYREEELIVLDLDQLPAYLRRLKGDQLNAALADMEKKIENLEMELNKYGDINRKIENRFRMSSDQFKSLKDKLNTSRMQLTTIENEFNRVKNERMQLFNQCFEQLSRLVDRFYKSLLRSRESVAFVQAENEEEPYLGGTSLICVPPHKSSFFNISVLSGGEQTIATLAFIFALNSYINPQSNFMLLDEVDAALDSNARENLVGFIKRQSSCLQTILVSLNRIVSKKATGIIGLYKQSGKSSIAIVTPNSIRFANMY